VTAIFAMTKDGVNDRAIQLEFDISAETIALRVYCFGFFGCHDGREGRKQLRGIVWVEMGRVIAHLRLMPALACLTSCW